MTMSLSLADRVLGRLAVAAANLLRGKHKPTFTPNVDGGDFVIVINADKIAVSGNKLTNKFAYRHSGYPGGMKSISLRDQLQTRLDRAIRAAVWGMLPHNRMGRSLLKRLKIYAEAEHPHAMQNPEPLA